MTQVTERGVRVRQNLLPLARGGNAGGAQDRKTGKQTGGARLSLPGVWDMAPDEPADEGELSHADVQTAAAHLSETSVGDADKAHPPVSFLAVAFRWGDVNGHRYHIYCGGDFQKAYALARAENADRGGKYACVVYGFAADGHDESLMCYFPSSMEEDDVMAPHYNHRKDFFERLGIFAHDAARGACLLPAISDPSRLTYQQVACPEFLKKEVERQRQVYQAFVDVDEQRAERAAKEKAS